VSASVLGPNLVTRRRCGERIGRRDLPLGVKLNEVAFDELRKRISADTQSAQLIALRRAAFAEAIEDERIEAACSGMQAGDPIVRRVDTRRAVALLGHTDARMTMGVYAELLKLGEGNVELLEQLMGCTRDEARAIFQSEPVLRTRSEPDAKKAPAPRRSKVTGAWKSARLQAIQRSG